MYGETREEGRRQGQKSALQSHPESLHMDQEEPRPSVSMKVAAFGTSTGTGPYRQVCHRPNLCLQAPHKPLCTEHSTKVCSLQCCHREVLREFASKHSSNWAHLPYSLTQRLQGRKARVRGLPPPISEALAGLELRSLSCLSSQVPEL